MNMTVSRMKESGFYYVKESIANSDELIDILHYLDFLAQNNTVDIGSMELPLDGNEFKLTKSDVTKLFFSHIEVKKEAITAAIVPLSETAEKFLRVYVKEARENGRRDQEDNITAKRSAANTQMVIAINILAEARVMQEKLECMKDQDPQVAIDAVIKGLPTTNWNFYGYDSYAKILKFVSRSDIIVIHKVPTAGISYELNCGKFRIEIRLTDMRVKYYGHSGYVESVNGDGTVIHPHISATNNICWGSAVVSAEEAIVFGDILKILQITDALLPNYGDAPWRVISDFQKDITKRDERLRRACEQKEKAPTIAAGEFGDQDFCESSDFDDLQFDETEGGLDVIDTI